MKHLSHSAWQPRLLLRIPVIALLLSLLVTLVLPPTTAHAAEPAFPTVPLSIDGIAVSERRACLIDGVTYVPFRAFCELQGCEVRWDAAVRAAYATTRHGVTVCAFADGALYLRYGERYFYTASPVRMIRNSVYIPLRPLAKCFGMEVLWNASERSVSLTSSGKAPRADVGVYETDALYWLSRIIEAEAAGEPFQGKLAVGNVVLNRVASPEFPATVYGVIFDRKFGVQFTPTANGSIYNTPSQESVIAARICLEGYSLSEEILYFFNPATASSSWIAAHRPRAFRIGNHVFYH